MANPNEDRPSIPSFMDPEIAERLRKKYSTSDQDNPWSSQATNLARDKFLDFQAGMPTFNPALKEPLLQFFGFDRSFQYQHMIATVSNEPFEAPLLKALTASEEVYQGMKLNSPKFWKSYSELVGKIYAPDRNLPRSFQTQLATSENCFMIGSAMIFRLVRTAGFCGIDDLDRIDNLYNIITDLGIKFRDRQNLSARVDSEYKISDEQTLVHEVLKIGGLNVPDPFSLKDGGIVAFTILDQNWQKLT